MTIPIYWGIETFPADKSFLTRATLYEVLPPFRESNRALRIRVSKHHWLHLGIYRYDHDRTIRLDFDPRLFKRLGYENGATQEGDDRATADVSIRQVVERRGVHGVGDESVPSDASGNGLQQVRPDAEGPSPGAA